MGAFTQPIINQSLVTATRAQSQAEASCLNSSELGGDEPLSAESDGRESFDVVAMFVLYTSLKYLS